MCRAPQAEVASNPFSEQLAGRRDHSVHTCLVKLELILLHRPRSRCRGDTIKTRLTTTTRMKQKTMRKRVRRRRRRGFRRRRRSSAEDDEEEDADFNPCRRAGHGSDAAVATYWPLRPGRNQQSSTSTLSGKRVCRNPLADAGLSDYAHECRACSCTLFAHRAY